MDAETFLGSIQNHQILFSSLIGFFYQHGIGCNVNKDKALEMYLLAIKQDEVQTINRTIAKYLLSLLYYKDIILTNKISTDLTINNPLKNKSIIPQLTNFNGSNTDLVKNDEKKELKEDDSNNSGNHNQKNIKEMNKSNDDALDFNCKDEIKINPDEKAKFEQYVISARRGNNIAQYNLGCCYDFGKGINKDKKKAFEWYSKSAEAGNDKAQYNFGCCDQYGERINKKEKKAFKWYLKSAVAGDNDAQNCIGRCYEYGIGTNKNEKKGIQYPQEEEIILHNII